MIHLDQAGKKSGIIITVIAIMFVSTVSSSSASDVLDQAPYAHSQRLISIDQRRRLNMYCTGHGLPTVLLESGAGEDTLTWSHVQPEIARFTKVCSYDRAGLGFSDFDPRPRDSSEIANDLQALVISAKVRQPFILVAHSSGGLSSILFADRHRAELAGLLLVDPSFANQGIALSSIPGVAGAFGKAKTPDWGRCIDIAASHQFPTDPRLVRLCLDRDQGYGPALQKALDDADMRADKWRSIASEMDNFNALPMAGHIDRDSAELGAETKSLGDLRLVVLTASSPFRPPGMASGQIVIPGMSAAQIEAFFETIKHGHDRLAALSSRGINIVVPDSGHYIQYDHPEVVIEHVKSLVDATRDKVGTR